MSDNIIKKNIDGIESDDELKLRMLANIKRKSEERERLAQTGKKTFAIAKWAIPAATCFAAAAVITFAVISKFAVSEELPSEPPEMVGSPFVTVSSAKELEEQLGFAADAPQGASDVEYSIIGGSTADVSFMYGKNAYSLRASEQTDDFSGLYGDETVLERLDDENGAILASVGDMGEVYLKLTWTKGKTVFILINTDGVSTEEIREIYGLLK